MDIWINSSPEWRGKDNEIEYNEKGRFVSQHINYIDIKRISLIKVDNKNRILRVELDNKTVELEFGVLHDAKVRKIIERIKELNPSAVDSISRIYQEEDDKKEEQKRITKSIGLKKYKDIIVTTCDLKDDYTILSTVFYQIGDAGPVLMELIKYYEDDIAQWKKIGQDSNDRLSTLETLSSLAYMTGGNIVDADKGGSANHHLFDVAFYIATLELKKRAFLLEADAIIGMKSEFNLDTFGEQHFYIQMYGTAVKINKKAE